MRSATCINLLPWREIERDKRKQAFGVCFLGLTVMVLGVAFVIHLLIDQRIDRQNQRNRYLQQEIAMLDRRNAQIRDLKKQKERLAQKMALIQSLQANRPMVVHMLDEVAQVLPTGIRLRRLDWDHDQIKILGLAESNAYVSALMRQIEQSAWLDRPELIEIKADQAGSKAVHTFSLMMHIKQQGSN